MVSGKTLESTGLIGTKKEGNNMKFVMKVTETLSRTVVIDANDQDDAISKVEQAYDNEDIVLDYKDYDGYDISAVRIACPGDLEWYGELEVKE